METTPSYILKLLSINTLGSKNDTFPSKKFRVKGLSNLSDISFGGIILPPGKGRWGVFSSAFDLRRDLKVTVWVKMLCLDRCWLKNKCFVARAPGARENIIICSEMYRYPLTGA